MENILCDSFLSENKCLITLKTFHAKNIIEVRQNDE